MTACGVGSGGKTANVGVALYEEDAFAKDGGGVRGAVGAAFGAFGCMAA